MPDQQMETLVSIWDKLSQPAQALTRFIAVAGGLAVDKPFLVGMAEGVLDEPELEKSLGELEGFKLLQKISLIDEKREQLASMKTPDEIKLTPIIQVPSNKLQEHLTMTESDIQYRNLLREIHEYDESSGVERQRYKNWEEIRFRLNSEFQNYMVSSGHVNDE